MNRRKIMGDSTVDSSPGRVAERTRHSWLAGFVIRLVKEKPLGTVGAVITLLLLLTGIFADFIAPHGVDDFTGDLAVAPSAKYWFGTDNLGRDLLSRVILGARISVIVGLSAATLGTLLSTAIGVLSGYTGGKLDLIVQRFVDGWMSFPALILLIVMLSLTGPGMWEVIIALGLWYGIVGSRTIRGATMSIREDVYVEAAVAIGCPTPRILTWHILPNVMGPAIMQFSLLVPDAMLLEAALSCLGFGIPPPAPSWGGMLSGSGREYMFLAPWMVIWPGLALSLVVYGTNMFGDALRDILDPRLRVVRGVIG